MQTHAGQAINTQSAALGDELLLAPIEKPKGLMMKLAYFFTRRQFGRVLTPLKVASARLPAGLGCFIQRWPRWTRS